jgi:hypothetical protein
MLGIFNSTYASKMLLSVTFSWWCSCAIRMILDHSSSVARCYSSSCPTFCLSACKTTTEYARLLVDKFVNESVENQTKLFFNNESLTNLRIQLLWEESEREGGAPWSEDGERSVPSASYTALYDDFVLMSLRGGMICLYASFVTPPDGAAIAGT